MLAEAEKKGVYRELHRMVMGNPLGFADDSFDAVICVGTLTVGHAPANSLEELVRVVRPGGYIVFTLRPDVYGKDGFKELQSAMEADGRWQLVEVGDPVKTLPKGEPDVFHQVWVYKVL
jgi:SAM-dependent methyltransferase